MPNYDYRCNTCTTQFEVRQSFSDDTLTHCPVEGGPDACESPGTGEVKKVFSGVGISFKGDGFYKNDHGTGASDRKKEAATASSESSSSSDTKTSDGSKSASSNGSASKSSEGSKSSSESASSSSSSSSSTKSPTKSD